MGIGVDALNVTIRELVKRIVNIAVCSLTCHTATGTHMPHRITQCYLPPDSMHLTRCVLVSFFLFFLISCF